MINEIRSMTKAPLLLLDAGSTLFGQLLAAQSEGRVIVEAMNAMGYDAMTVGQLDLYQGVDTLLARAQESQFPILSCNLVTIQEQRLLLEPFTVVERGGIRFGILGVTEQEAASSPVLSSVVRVLEPVATVQRYFPELREKCDVVILLSHLGLDADMALAQQVAGIHVIVGGRTRKLLAQPERAGNTVITQVGYDGEWLGKLEVTLGAGGQVAGAAVSIISLPPDVPDDPALADLVARWKAKYP